jgi:mono/diheme cytochrome c family protein
MPSARRRRRAAWVSAAALVVVAALAVGSWSYREDRVERRADAAIGGVGERAIPIMLANGCAGCHTISGVPGAQGQVGPRLDATLSSKLYIAGVLPNSRKNMIQWLRSARELVPHTAMPSTGISDQEARDVAAYLYAIR